MTTILTFLSNKTNYEQTNMAGAHLSQQWLDKFNMEMSSFTIHQTGLHVVVHAREQETVNCMWDLYQAGELSIDATHTLGGIFPESLLRNFTYSVSLDREEVALYKDVHLHTQGIYADIISFLGSSFIRQNPLGDTYKNVL